MGEPRDVLLMGGLEDKEPEGQAVGKAFWTTDVRKALPLYNDPSGENWPWSARIVIDMKTGKVWPTTIPPQKGRPPEVERGYLQRAVVNPYVLGDALEEFLESEEAKELVKRAVEGAVEVWDGEEGRIKLTEDAMKALVEFENRLWELPRAIVYTPEEVLPAVYKGDERTGLHYIGGRLVTGEVLPEIFEEYPEVLTDGEYVYAIPRLHEWFEKLAEENAKRLGELMEGEEGERGEA